MQNKVKMNLIQILMNQKTGYINQGSKKVHCTTLERITKHDTVLIIFLLNILQLDLSLN